MGRWWRGLGLERSRGEEKPHPPKSGVVQVIDMAGKFASQKLAKHAILLFAKDFVKSPGQSFSAKQFCFLRKSLLKFSKQFQRNAEVGLLATRGSSFRLGLHFSSFFNFAFFVHACSCQKYLFCCIRNCPLMGNGLKHLKKTSGSNDTAAIFRSHNRMLKVPPHPHA